MPSSLMQTLDEAALGREPYEIKPAEINLILSAERWLTENGWDVHWFRGWSDDNTAFSADPDGGLVIRRRRHNLWDTDGERHPVRSVVAGLNILVNEGILPACFSTFGSQALADFAEALERAAAELDGNDLSASHRADVGALRYAKADGLRRAAEVAREHNPIAVLS